METQFSQKMFDIEDLNNLHEILGDHIGINKDSCIYSGEASLVWRKLIPECPPPVILTTVGTINFLRRKFINLPHWKSHYSLSEILMSNVSAENIPLSEKCVKYIQGIGYDVVVQQSDEVIVKTLYGDRIYLVWVDSAASELHNTIVKASSNLNSIVSDLNYKLYRINQ